MEILNWVTSNLVPTGALATLLAVIGFYVRTLSNLPTRLLRVALKLASRYAPKDDPLTKEDVLRIAEIIFPSPPTDGPAAAEPIDTSAPGNVRGTLADLLTRGAHALRGSPARDTPHSDTPPSPP